MPTRFLSAITKQYSTTGTRVPPPSPLPPLSPFLHLCHLYLPSSSQNYTSQGWKAIPSRPRPIHSRRSCRKDIPYTWRPSQPSQTHEGIAQTALAFVRWSHFLVGCTDLENEVSVLNLHLKCTCFSWLLNEVSIWDRRPGVNDLFMALRSKL